MQMQIRLISLEERHDNYVAAMRRWVIRGSEKNKSEQEHKQ